MTVIIQYNAGNIQSVRYALARIGAEATVTDDPALIRAAERVIFPGVGEASTAMAYLQERGLDEVIRRLVQPVLGICLGMQLMCSYSEENDTDCVGIFEERVRQFAPEASSGPGPGAASGHESNVSSGPERRAASGHESGLSRAPGGAPTFKVPQIGWNTIYDLETPLLAGLPEESYCYFVHGYYAALGAHTIAKTDYIRPYSSALHRGNFYGVQFHPEKSAAVGEKILKNFMSL